MCTNWDSEASLQNTTAMTERSTIWTCQTAGTGGDGSWTVSVVECNVNVTLRDQRYVLQILFMCSNGTYLI